MRVISSNDTIENDRASAAAKGVMRNSIAAATPVIRTQKVRQEAS
jgi:hypothetical protein